MAKRLFLSIISILSLITHLKAQNKKSDELYKLILSKDSLLFNVGFNQCDVSQFENLLDENFEFYHDKDGFSDKKKFLNDLRSGLCKDPKNYQAKRILISNNTQIFPLYNKNEGGKLYGVVQYGEHRFSEKVMNQPETNGSTAKFTHLWLLKNGLWKLCKSYSYDHQLKNTEEATSIFDNDKEIENWLKTNNVPALGLGVIEDGKLKQIKVFGELKKGISAPYNTIFNVASLTKPITAMVALQLINSGKWNLDEPLYKYWTDLDIANDPRSKKLTTRIILSHQTGFPNWRENNKDGKLSFEFEPGTKYQYSGEGMEYLRKALENKFHQSLEQLAKELIFQPLKMKDTYYTWNNPIDSSRVAVGYNPKGIAYKTVQNNQANGADDVLTTIEDYGNFLVSVLNGAHLKSELYQEITKPQVKTKANKYFGLGFEIYDLGNGEFALSHGGSDFGTNCITFILPKTKQGILIFTNVDDGYKVYEKILKHYLGERGEKIIEIETK